MGAKMHKWILMVSLLIGATAQAHATTYEYTGAQFTYFSGLCGPGSCTKVSGSVTFDIDTSHYSGTLSLTGGDTAYFSEGIGVCAGIICGYSPSFPAYTQWFNPPQNTYGYLSKLAGNFTLVDGSITSWSLNGSTFQVGCGGGPGCISGMSSLNSNSGDDAVSLYSEPVNALVLSFASSSEAGVWVGEFFADPVPEPSTWAMMLIGFAGIGFAAYRKRCTIASA
jgi:PEP-CTERM motif